MAPEPFVRFASPVAELHRMASLCLGYGWAPHETRRCGWRQLPSFGAVLITDGSGWFESAETRGRRPVRANTLFWLFPGVPHRYAPEPWWEEQWVLFTGALASQYEQMRLLSRRDPMVDVSADDEIHRTFGDIHDFFASLHPLTSVYAGAVIPRIVTAVHRHASARGSDAAGTGSSSDAVRQLAESALTDVDLTDVARACGMSPATLRRHVRKETGSSPVEFVRRVRMEAAKHMLATTHLGVQRIGEAVGYDSPNYFTRVFTLHEGISPSLFRSQQRRQSSGSHGW